MTEQTQSLDVQQEHQKFIEDLGDMLDGNIRRSLERGCGK